jgi:hypothetical protein
VHICIEGEKEFGDKRQILEGKNDSPKELCKNKLVDID